MQNSGDRVIFHIDCNAFYASVAEIDRPELKRVPMVVCGDPDGRRGVVLAKNELAKGHGVNTGDTVWQAKQKCPWIEIVPPRHDLYRDYCVKLNELYGQYTDQVERFGIDESYLDVTGSLHLFGGRSVELANELRRRIRYELGLTVSIGISWCKVFAKLGSDLKKPDAVTHITRGNYQSVVWPLPVSALLYVGKSTADALALMGITTIRQLAQADSEMLRSRLGKVGVQIHEYACGTDDSAVQKATEAEEVHSVGSGMTFRRDLTSFADIRTAVTALSDNVASRLRRYGVKSTTIQVTIKDPQLRSISRRRQVAAPTYLAAEIAETALEVIDRNWQKNIPIRMLTVTAQRLVDEAEPNIQLSLFDTPHHTVKKEKLEKTVDIIRERYGKSSISSSSLLSNDLGIDQ